MASGLSLAGEGSEVPAGGAGVTLVLGVNQELVSCRGCLEQPGHRSGLQKCCFTSVCQSKGV